MILIIVIIIIIISSSSSSSSIGRAAPPAPGAGRHAAGRAAEDGVRRRLAFGRRSMRVCKYMSCIRASSKTTADSVSITA